VLVVKGAADKDRDVHYLGKVVEKKARAQFISCVKELRDIARLAKLQLLPRPYVMCRFLICRFPEVGTSWQRWGALEGASAAASLNVPLSRMANARLQIYLGDITTLRVDAVVNSANARLEAGGGVDKAIREAAGRDAVADALRPYQAAGGCKPGQACYTSGCRLPAKYIIHAVGPDMNNPAQAANANALLRSTYSSILEAAEYLDVATVAIPCISTGAFHLSHAQAASVAAEALRAYFDRTAAYGKVSHPFLFLFVLFYTVTTLLQMVVILVVLKSDTSNRNAYKNALPEYFPLQ
jgi:O-acetyl-ADP-ribose deacetylase (regulator of RNase III)